MSRKIQISIRKLLKADERLQKYLVEIVRQVKPQTITITLKCLNKVIANPIVWDHFFKILILLNNFIVNDQIPLNQASRILTIMKLKQTDKDDFENVLINELLIPYHFYLQKRCGIAENFENQKKEVRCFGILNLLNTGACFSKMIFRLARYYPTKLKYAEDFNIAWAADLSEMYYKMTRCVCEPFQQNLKDELQPLHEMLYNVFYNCYFHKHLLKFVPRWIRTDDSKLPRSIRTSESKTNPQQSAGKKKLQPKTVDCSEQKSNQESSNKTIINQLNFEYNQVSQFNSDQYNSVNMNGELQQFMELTRQFELLQIAIRKEERMQLPDPS